MGENEVVGSEAGYYTSTEYTEEGATSEEPTDLSQEDVTSQPEVDTDAQVAAVPPAPSEEEPEEELVYTVAPNPALAHLRVATEQVTTAPRQPTSSSFQPRESLKRTHSTNAAKYAYGTWQAVQKEER